MSEILRESSIQFFTDVNYLYERIKTNINQFNSYENTISELEKGIRKKRQVFCKRNIPFVYIVSILFFIIIFSPFYFKSVFLIFPAMFIGFLFCYGFILLYKKKILVKWEKNHKEIIKPIYDKCSEILEDLIMCCSEYEDLSMYLPDDCKNEIAVYLMNESLLNDYATSVDDAVDFYKKRYEILKIKTDSMSIELVDEIKKSEKMQIEKEKNLTEAEQKLNVYLKQSAEEKNP